MLPSHPSRPPPRATYATHARIRRRAHARTRTPPPPNPAVVRPSSTTNAQALNHFRAGKTPVLVSSDLGARGLDLPRLPAVINFDPPPTLAQYVHRLGRTGRQGAAGTVVSILKRGDPASRRFAADVSRVLSPLPLELAGLLAGEDCRPPPRTEQKPSAPTGGSGVPARAEAATTSDEREASVQARPEVQAQPSASLAAPLRKKVRGAGKMGKQRKVAVPSSSIAGLAGAPSLLLFAQGLGIDAAAT